MLLHGILNDRSEAKFSQKVKETQDILFFTLEEKMA